MVQRRDAASENPLPSSAGPRVRRAGYDGALSIEHEDMALSPMEGMRKSVELLRRVIIVEPPSHKLPGIQGAAGRRPTPRP